MTKIGKFFKKLKNLNTKNIIQADTTNISITSKQPKIGRLKTTKFKFNYGNLEFGVFCVLVSYGLYKISAYRDIYSETTRLIAAGIATHIVVDIVTYLGDKINTKVKVDTFYVKKEPIKTDLNFYFEKKFLHFSETKQVKRIRTTSLGNYLGDLHFRGLQATMVFVVINSTLFYGFYKNIKAFLSEKLNIKGFPNFFLSAAISQFIAMLFAFPLENIKTRMQASNFSYDSFFKYYKKLFKGKPTNVIYKNIKIEYSGFVSHLLLYVVYESVTFAIYESIMKMKYFNKLFASEEEHKEKHIELNDKHNDKHNVKHRDVNMYLVLFAGAISGLISAIVTNPIDVYQINKQINPKFNLNMLDRRNIMTGMKERIIFVTFLNITTFLFLEFIGPKYYNVSLE
jgi:hypothetical protein